MIVSFFLGDLGERKKEKRKFEVEVKNKDSKQEQILKEVEEGGEDFQTQRKRQRRLRRMKKVGNINVIY